MVACIIATASLCCNASAEDSYIYVSGGEITVDGGSVDVDLVGGGDLEGRLQGLQDSIDNIGWIVASISFSGGALLGAEIIKDAL